MEIKTTFEILNLIYEHEDIISDWGEENQNIKWVKVDDVISILDNFENNKDILTIQSMIYALRSELRGEK